MRWRSGVTWVDPGSDPEFAPLRGKSGTMAIGGTHFGKGHSRPRFQRQFLIRLLALLLGAVWLGIVLDPMIGPLFLCVCLALVLTLGVMASAMALGMLGFGLFAAGERFITWVGRGRAWPNE